MNNESEKKENSLTENLKAVGQEILGELELVGGILTGDPATRAEGEFNAQVGSLHQESNKNSNAVENREESVRGESSLIAETEAE